MIVVAVTAVTSAISLYFYLRPPVLRPLSERGRQSAIRIGRRQEIHE